MRLLIVCEFGRVKLVVDGIFVIAEHKIDLADLARREVELEWCDPIGDQPCASELEASRARPPAVCQTRDTGPENLALSIIPRQRCGTAK